MAKSNPTVAALRRAVEGLVYVSESEAGLEPFLWTETGELNAQRLLKLVGAEGGTTVATATLESFFRTVPPEDKADFDRLAKTLTEQLTGIQVYRLGDDAEKQVYVVGKTSDGHWAGLRTSVVET